MKRAACILLLTQFLLAAPYVIAQSSYPDKPIRIISQSPPGGGPDIIARLFAQKFSEAWGKPVIIENAPGAAGIVAASRVAKSSPDGYTLGFTGDAPMTTNVTLYNNLPYNPLRDFALITIVAQTPNLLVIHPSVPIKDLKGLISLAKAHPGKLSFASAGAGTSQHLAGELLKSMASINIVHVPYKGGGTQPLQDVVSGEVAMLFGNITGTLPFVRSGRLRALAVSSAKRASTVPDIPTVAESGLPGFEAVAWFGFIAPAGTPPSITAKIHQEAIRVLAQPDVRNRMAGLGAEVMGNTPEEFATQVRAEISQKGKIVKESGAKPD